MYRLALLWPLQIALLLLRLLLLLYRKLRYRTSGLKYYSVLGQFLYIKRLSLQSISRRILFAKGTVVLEEFLGDILAEVFLNLDDENVSLSGIAIEISVLMASVVSVHIKSHSLKNCIIVSWQIWISRCMVILNKEGLLSHFCSSTQWTSAVVGQSRT